MNLLKRPLGATRFLATQLGIGDVADRSVPLQDCVATVHRALDAGLNLIDTAPAYEDGYSEMVVGAALKGRRDGIFVIDKVDHLDQPVVPQVERSLRALQMDMVDLFVFHGLTGLDQWESLSAPGGGMDQLAGCIDEGKARFRGISCHNPEVLRAALESGLCDVVMFAIGPFCDARYVTEILPLARQKGVGTVCFKTFGAGKLLGDTTGYNQPLATRPRGKFSSGGKDVPSEPELPRLTAAECLHYTLTVDPDVALLGLSFPNEQDAAFQAYRDFKPLTAGELADVESRARVAIDGKGPCWWNPA